MCIVIDICTLAPVFESSCKKHSDFKPVLDWINQRKGKMIYGGKTYRKELLNGKYRKIIIELTKAGKAKELPEEEVNHKTVELGNTITHRDYDDPHIIAITIVSRSRIICSDDERAYPFFQKPLLYPNKFKLPKIYRGLGSKGILNSGNVCKSCQETKQSHRRHRR